MRVSNQPHQLTTATKNAFRRTLTNNAAERSLRGIAIGRKNWLFVGSERGGHTAATILMLITSVIRHHLDPFAYLRDVLRRLPTTEPDNLTNLLPNRWRPE